MILHHHVLGLIPVPMSRNLAGQDTEMVLRCVLSDTPFVEWCRAVGTGQASQAMA